jgi:hypothetical protein
MSVIYVCDKYSCLKAYPIVESDYRITNESASGDKVSVDGKAVTIGHFFVENSHTHKIISADGKEVPCNVDILLLNGYKIINDLKDF